MSLKELLQSTGQARLAAAAAGLKATTVYALNVGYKKRQEQNKHWVYVPEKEYPFYRLGFPHTYSPLNAPAGHQSVCAEVSVKGRIPARIDSTIIEGLLRLGIIECPEDICLKYSLLLKNAYVIFDAYRDRVVPEIERHLAKMGVLLAGRWGRWEYSSMEDAIRQGFAAADKING
jgi:protoporphyrinogen oxidase